MKVAILGDAGSVHIRRIARGLNARGHAVRVISHKVAAVPGATVERFCVPLFGWRHPMRWERRRRGYLRQIMHDHDVVHVNFLNDWWLTEDVVAEGRLVATPWGSDIVKPPDLVEYPPGVREMRRSLLRMAHRVAVYGRIFARTVAEFAGLREHGIAQVPLGVDLTRFRPRGHNGSGPATVGYFKGFKAVYGPEVWLRALPIVRRALPDVRFDFVGKGPLRDHCRSLSKTLGVADAICWYDHQCDEAMPELIAGWEVSVMPSLCESFGVAALESSASGVPVVASRVGGIPDTVRHGETGLLVTAGDSAALAESVIQLLTDDRRRRQMAAAGREWVSREYDWNSCLSRLIQVYEEVCDQRRASSALQRSDAAVAGCGSTDGRELLSVPL